MPTSATIRGRHFLTLRRSARCPLTYSDGRSDAMPEVGRGTRFVIPQSHSGSRSSSLAVSGSVTIPDAYKSFQNRLEYPAK